MENTFDAIVIGAGYIGCSVAYHLCAAGIKTALFDRGPLAAGATRANFGNIQVQDMELRYSAEMIQIARRRFAHLEQELDWKVGLRRIGGLLPIENEIQWAIMEQRLKVVRAAGIHSELLPAEHLHEVEPWLDTTGLLGGLYHADEGQVDPFRLIWGYLVRARQLGLKEYYFTEVTGFDQRSGRMQGIVTPAGRFSAGSVVLCCGAGTAQLGRLLGRDWGIKYILGQAIVTEPVTLGLRNHLASASFFEPAEPGLKGAVRANFAISQSPHGHLLLGEAMVEAGYLQRHVPHPSMPMIAACVLRYFPSFRKLRVLRGWSAPVAEIPDGLPLLGPAADLQGLFLATAFRSTVIVTPLAGETVAQLITQGKSELTLDHFLPERTMNL